MKARAQNNMPFSLKSVTDIGIIAYIGVSRWLENQAQSAPSQMAELSSIAGLVVSIGAGVWIASRMWEQFRSRGEINKSSIEVEEGRIKSLERIETVNKLELVERRAKVDKELLKLELRADNFKERIALLETRHNRLRDAFNRMAGSLAPILKDMDVDLSRLDIVGKLMANSDEEPTNDGSL